jgi:hypothetical protein
MAFPLSVKMKERFEQLASKIFQLPDDEQTFIRQLVEVVEREVDRKLNDSRKWCNKCRKSKLRSEFYPRKNGLRSTCKECNRY